MSIAPLYCHVCGAVNAANDRNCFACGEALDRHPISSDLLLHDRYQILSQVGTGGFGTVYKALDTQAQDRIIAIKQITLRGLKSQEQIEATDGFHREVQMLTTLSHPNLPKIYAHFTDAEHWYVVMDFIEGETLEQYLRDITASETVVIRALPLDEILDIVLQLCHVLTYLHTRQPAIIFRDLKPDNIMRTPNGKLSLIDFGTARYFKPGQAKDTIPLGSPGYAAPEQYGRAQTTPRADIYSLGALLYHLLSRRDPAETPLLRLDMLDAYQRPANTHEGELNALIQRMVASDVSQRPSSVDEIEAELQRWRADGEARIWRPTQEPMPLPTSSPGWYQPGLSHQQQQMMSHPTRIAKTSRRKFIVGSIALASAIGMVGFGTYWHNRPFSHIALTKSFPKDIPSPSFPVNQPPISSIAWSYDNTYLAFGFQDGTIMGGRVSSTGDYSIFVPIFSISDHQPINFLAWSPDGIQLTIMSQSGLRLAWTLSADGPPIIQEMSQPTGVATQDQDAGATGIVSWSPNGQTMASSSQGNLNCYKMPERELMASFQMISGNAIAWSPNSQLIVVEKESPTSSLSLEILDAKLFTAISTFFLHSSPTTIMAWSPDGKAIAFITMDGTIHVLDAAVDGLHPNSPIWSSRNLSANRKLLAWSPDSRYLATIDDDGRLLILNSTSGDIVISIATPNRSSDALYALTWLDGTHIALATDKLELWRWELS
jgi:serine/threonine protein kinase